VELRTTWNVVSEFELICGIEDLESTEFELICGIEDLEWIEFELICRIKEDLESSEFELICGVKEDLEWSEFVESRTWNRSTEWGNSRGRTLYGFNFTCNFFSSFLVGTVCVSLFIGCEILHYCQNLKFFVTNSMIFLNFFEFFYKLLLLFWPDFYAWFQ